MGLLLPMERDSNDEKLKADSHRLNYVDDEVESVELEDHFKESTTVEYELPRCITDEEEVTRSSHDERFVRPDRRRERQRIVLSRKEA